MLLCIHHSFRCLSSTLYGYGCSLLLKSDTFCASLQWGKISSHHSLIFSCTLSLPHQYSFSCSSCLSPVTVFCFVITDAPKDAAVHTPTRKKNRGCSSITVLTALHYSFLSVMRVQFSEVKIYLFPRIYQAILKKRRENPFFTAKRRSTEDSYFFFLSPQLLFMTALRLHFQEEPNQPRTKFMDTAVFFFFARH